MRSTARVDPLSGRGSGIDHLSVLARLQGSFLSGVERADPRAPVPRCAPWRVADLVQHLAYIHHWAAAQARGTRASPLGDAPSDLASHYAACAAELRDTLTDLGPDAVSRTLLGPGPASFWHRRQVHETLVHLHDLRAAGGDNVDTATVDDVGEDDVGAEVWADAVDEVVTVLQPRQVRLERMGSLARTVALTAPDTGGTWVLGGHEDTRSLGEPAATLTAPAHELALVLWRRLTVEDTSATVTGERAALDGALAQPIVP
ncbi:maleylpyruvate isomerase family mycothiol-dependent enzyme [Georgenia halophila]|uniref:Maleylpyruvate isomerase family mycothiol-dependent enzyme n=1 Tax=Georgenia halophila TaxID=620889 RepID=A0ABP8LNA1_9MICO